MHCSAEQFMTPKQVNSVPQFIVRSFCFCYKAIHQMIWEVGSVMIYCTCTVQRSAALRVALGFIYNQLNRQPPPGYACVCICVCVCICILFVFCICTMQCFVQRSAVGRCIR